MEKVNRKVSQVYTRRAEHPVTHHIHHAIIAADKTGAAIASFPAVLQPGYNIPSIRELQKIIGK